MANDRRIKGLTIEIGGDTTQLSESLHDVNKDVEKLLKLDPTNTEMLAQKQELLTQAISKTKEKLETLKDAAVQAEKQLGEGKISQEQFAALQREIAATEIELKRYSSQLDTAQMPLKIWAMLRSRRHRIPAMQARRSANSAMRRTIWEMQRRMPVTAQKTSANLPGIPATAFPFWTGLWRPLSETV